VSAASDAIRYGETEVAVAGAYDSLLQMDCVVEHLLAGRLARAQYPPKQACRPFDRGRSGYALGEGAAFLVLESLAHARRRGAEIYAEILSTGDATESSLLIQEDRADGEALAAAARQALDSAGIEAGDVDAVFGDGTAVCADDVRECNAYGSLFGHCTPAFTGATAAIGYTGAASGAFALMHAALAVKERVLPPTINCDDPVPECPWPVLRERCAAELDKVLVWNSDRGLKNAAVLISRAES
jgi:3-oxoacyl-[acyl-carrier-protein] synthase II